MKGLKKILLGIAFLLVALMGAVMYGDFGYVLFIIGTPLGLIFAIIGCFDDQISRFLNRIAGKSGEDGE